MMIQICLLDINIKKKNQDITCIFIDSPNDVNDIPPVRIIFPDGSNILSNHRKDDMCSVRSNNLSNDYRLSVENSISSPRLPSIAIVYISSLAKGISEILLFLHVGHICCWSVLLLLSTTYSFCSCFIVALWNMVAHQKHDSQIANWHPYSYTSR